MLATKFKDGIDKEIRHSLILGRGDEAKLELSIPEEERLVQRLLGKYKGNKRKVRRDLMFERLFELHYHEETDKDLIRSIVSYYSEKNRHGLKYPFIHENEEPFDVMFKLLQPTFEKKAEKYAAENKGIRKEEFLAEFNEELFRLVYLHKKNPNYTLYESIEQSFKARATDVVRREWGSGRTKQRRFEREAISLDAMEEHGTERKAEFDFLKSKDFHDPTAKEVEAKVIVQELLHGDLLEEDERQVILYMFENNGASLREIGRNCEIDDKKVKRIRTKVMNKVKESFGELHELI